MSNKYIKEPKTNEIENYEEVSFFEELFKYALIHLERPWSNIFALKDQKYDNFQYTFTSKLPVYDMKAYLENTHYQHVYDKLWVANSQHIKCGNLDLLNSNEVEYPIFIKPKYGHKTASSKHCYKIKSNKELKNYTHLKNMMWSEFLPSTEGMTDFVFVNGNIVYQLTYKYSDKQNGFTDDYKYISPYTKAPKKIVDWVNRYFKSYTGVVNVQYRGDIIIEVGLRLSRGGNYILSTNNRELIVNINHLYNNNEWNYKKEYLFKPFYSFKCFSKLPILYILPQPVNNYIFKDDILFHDYYFEPAGKDGDVFYQFSCHDFERGLALKKKYEILNTKLQTFFILFGLFVILFLIINYKAGITLFMAWCALYISRFLNPIHTSVSWMRVLISKID